ncbi:MAG TPA: GNAT family N-acetyltransferase, partial [Ilumatobacteraceae bacterium]|nr:GNAT family N-acetyltransferase [Ilumatobacteraceae bacterium]
WASAGAERITLLARQGERVVGIAGGYRDEIEPDQVHLVSMWTAPEVRRIGLGRLLVGAVIEWAADTRASSVGLWVTCGNTPAQLLYESIGFRETGEYQALPSDPCADEIRMILRLPE